MELYYAPYSPPCRAVMLAAELIGVPLKLKLIDIFYNEHLTVEYDRICPEKRIPLLVDGDFKINESRAIMIYLFERYGENPEIYPPTPKKRALVNQAFHFDMGILYSSITQYYFPVVFGREKFSPERREKLNDSFRILNKILASYDYVAGKNLTLADLSTATSVSTALAFGYDWKTFSNVQKWLKKVKRSAPGYKEINEKGDKILKQLVKETALAKKTQFKDENNEENESDEHNHEDEENVDSDEIEETEEVEENENDEEEEEEEGEEEEEEEREEEDQDEEEEEDRNIYEKAKTKKRSFRNFFRSG